MPVMPLGTGCAFSGCVLTHPRPYPQRPVAPIFSTASVTPLIGVVRCPYDTGSDDLFA